MNMSRFIFAALFACAGLCTSATVATASASKSADRSDAMNRTHAQNFKDAALAACIAAIADKKSTLNRDANSSAHELFDLSFYDIEKGLDEVDRLTEKYLKRDYVDPLPEDNNEGVRFDVVKCIDMYHSKELAALVKRLVFKPNYTYRQEYPHQK